MPLRLQAILDRAGDAITVKRVFGEPYERDGVAVIPVAIVLGGGGGGSGTRLNEAAGPWGGAAGAGTAAPGGGSPAVGAPAGAGGGFGLLAWPVGADVVAGGAVRWRPAVNVNLLVLGTQLVALAAILTAGARRRRRREEPKRRGGPPPPHARRPRPPEASRAQPWPVVLAYPEALELAPSAAPGAGTGRLLGDAG